MTHASLFSGIGGFDLAAEWAGWTNVFNCEIDPFCQQILKYHFPNATQYSDIKSTDFALWRGRVDVLTGGFPCQPFSLAGKRKGTEDDRHLWPQMLRAIREIQPRWVVGENVLGIVDWSKGLVFEQVCSDLEAQGYEVQPYVIPACGVDAPHRRYRVWFVAKNTERVRRDGDQPEEEPRAGRFGQFSTGDHVRVCGASGIDSDGSEDVRERADGVHAAGAAADAHSIERTARMHRKFKENSTEERTGIYNRITRLGNDEAIADADHQRLEQQSRNPVTNQPRQLGRHTTPCGFDAFPTQSPVCGRNDGISYGLDGITFPKWRMQSIKAYGNAIVPQVAYQIFEAINEFELVK